MRQKQYSETIRQHNRNTSPKPQVPSWNTRSRDETDKSYSESKRAAVSTINLIISVPNEYLRVLILNYQCQRRAVLTAGLLNPAVIKTVL